MDKRWIKAVRQVFLQPRIISGLELFKAAGNTPFLWNLLPYNEKRWYTDHAFVLSLLYISNPSYSLRNPGVYSLAYLFRPLLDHSPPACKRVFIQRVHDAMRGFESFYLDQLLLESARSSQADPPISLQTIVQRWCSLPQSIRDAYAHADPYVPTLHKANNSTEPDTLTTAPPPTPSPGRPVVTLPHDVLASFDTPNHVHIHNPSSNHTDQSECQSTPTSHSSAVHKPTPADPSTSVGEGHMDSQVAMSICRARLKRLISAQRDARTSCAALARWADAYVGLSYPARRRRQRLIHSWNAIMRRLHSVPTTDRPSIRTIGAIRRLVMRAAHKAKRRLHRGTRRRLLLRRLGRKRLVGSDSSPRQESHHLPALPQFDIFDLHSEDLLSDVLDPPTDISADDADSVSDSYGRKDTI